MFLGYSITFKLIDRGILEAFGSVSAASVLGSLFRLISNSLETGALYLYALIQLILVLLIINCL